jgi:hypothetical protein
MSRSRRRLASESLRKVRKSHAIARRRHMTIRDVVGDSGVSSSATGRRVDDSTMASLPAIMTTTGRMIIHTI